MEVAYAFLRLSVEIARSHPWKTKISRARDQPRGSGAALIAETFARSALKQYNGGTGMMGVHIYYTYNGRRIYIYMYMLYT